MFKIGGAASASGKQTPILTIQNSGMAVPLSGIELLFFFHHASNLVTILTELHRFPLSNHSAKRLLDKILDKLEGSLRKGILPFEFELSLANME
jgi:hypothetical protein